jgi:DNA invertase Pin-like site-specific DNA recombinase
MSWTPEEYAQIDAAIRAGKLTRAEPPPPMDPDALAREYAAKPASPRAAGEDIPDATVKMIRDMEGLYSREAIADRAEVSMAIVRQILGPTPRGRRKITPDMLKAILELRNRESIQALATRFGLGQATICRALKEAGATKVIRPRKPRPKKEPRPRSPDGKRAGDYVRKVTDEARQQIIQARGSAPLTEIAARFGVSRPTVSKIYHDAGLADPHCKRVRPARAHEIQPDELAEILKLRGTLSAAAIGRRLDRNPTSIRRLFVRIDEARAAAVASVRQRTPRGCPPEAAASSPAQ